MGIKHIATLVWSVLGGMSLLIGQTAHQQPASQVEFLATTYTEMSPATQPASVVLWQTMLPELATLRQSADAAFIPNQQGHIAGFATYGKAAPLAPMGILDATQTLSTSIYDDALASGWSNWSWGGTYTFNHASAFVAGSHAIEADFGAWGALNLRHSSALTTTGIDAVRFWVKADGAYPIRVRTADNDVDGESDPALFMTSTEWEQKTIYLSELGSPATIKRLVFQLYKNATGTVYFDQIEWIDATSDNCASAGKITMYRYEGISGTAIANLTSATAYPYEPTYTELLTSFEGPSNILSNYGVRIIGEVCAPQDGNYLFWIAGDDNVELWLTHDGIREKIAYHTSWTSSREWTKHSTQESDPIYLEAGKTYEIEALMKEGGGGDNIAVGWQLPDGTLERPIPGNRLIPYTYDGAGSGPIIQTCTLTAYNNTSHAIILPGITGETHYVSDGNLVFTEYENGSATITGQVVGRTDNTYKWDVYFLLERKRSYSEWTAIGGSAKGIAKGDETTWDYYELSHSSYLSGAGNHNGKYLTINNYDVAYAMQKGVGANDKDTDEGLSGWFAFYGSFSGQGDVNVDASCSTTSTLNPPPSPTCASGKLSWENPITINGSNVNSTVRLKDGGTTAYSLPITLPAEFNSAVEVTIDEAISWDGYSNRNTINQANEQWKVAFFKNGVLEASSHYTTDLIDNVVSNATVESLGTISLPNGADEVKLIHYEDGSYGEGSSSSSNSVNPVSICMSYQSVSSCPGVTADGFKLNDLTGSSDIILVDGESYLFSSLPTKFNLEALASGSNIERVAIYVNGDYAGSTLSQNSAPYEFPTDNVQWYVGGGTYTVTEKVIVAGDTCQVQTITFSITGGDNLPADCESLVNGSFEDGTNGWTLGSNTQGVNTEFHLSDGSSAFSINQIGFTGADAEIHQDVALAAEDEGCTYTVDFYAGTTDNWYTHKVYLEFYNGSGTLLSSESVEIDSDIWYNPLNQPLPSYSLSAVVPTGAATLRIKGTASGDFLKLDGFCLTHTCPATCTEVINGGLIGYDQENCGPYNPDPMLSIEPASPGSSEKIEYQWRYAADSAIDLKYWAIKKNWSEDHYDIAGEQRFTVYFVRMARCEDDTEYVPSNIVTIKVNRPPIAHFGFDQGKCALDDISFEALNRRNVSYTWSFPNSLDPTGTPYAPVTPLGRNVTTSYLNPGFYEATLTVTDTLTGCVTTSTDTIGVDNCNTCSNLTSAGAIEGNQASCTLPFDPDPLTESEAVAGGVGNITYQWYSTNDPLTPFMEWTKLANSNSATYDPGSLSETTYFIRAAKRDNCNSFLYSNTLTVEIGEDIEYLCTSEEVAGEAFSFQLPGTEVASFGDQYRWVGENGSFTTYYDGTAYLRGTIENINNINLRWEVNLKLVNRSDYIQWKKNASSLAGQYMPSVTGGSMEHLTWNYYTIDSAESYFLGVYYFDGDTVRPGEGYVQRGMGANTIDSEMGWALTADHATGTGTHLVCTPICIPSLRVTCKVLLAGFIDGNTGNMRTYLKALNLLPTTQPYGPIFGYYGTESITSFPEGMVDWVLLELRDHDNYGSILERKAVILLEDGTLLDPSTDQLPVMTIANALDDHYLVVRHRNHMGIMSATAEGNSLTAMVAYDFTQSVDKVYKSSIFNPINPPAFQIPDGRWALIPGDIDATRNQLNNASDGLQITLDQQSASIGYFLGDLNGDGVPNATDQYILWSLFLNMYGHLPFGK